ncbi:DUF6942 family protein [Saccharospirillum alexandrii]|uniref:DUF6942 family protein n=1 Tax=Saccharospirillum alexandrii TaxID=2448477 RepID=UPI000FD86183|nr:hypothetical protein [Saccharospirillum alexandrii]
MFNATGLGDASPSIVVCAPHRPPSLKPNQPNQLLPLAGDDLHRLVQGSGNHWRKIFNLYAKLLHGLTPREPDWQTCREQRLLQAGSACALVFEHKWVPEPGQLCVVMGQTYGRSLGWLADDQVLPAVHPFVQHPEQAVIVTPYFDYRPLSNARLASLVQLIATAHPHWLAAFSERSHQFSAH